MPEKFEMLPKEDPKEETLDEVLERFGGKLEKGPDRSRDSVGRNISDPQEDEAKRVYDKHRKINKRKQEKERARKTKNLATDAQRMEWNDSRRGGEAGL